MLGGWPERPAPGLGVDGGGVGGGQFGQGAVDGDHPGGAALGAQSGRELLGGEGAVVAEGPEDAGGGRPEPGGGRVGELGQGAVVGAAEGVPRQHCAGALLDPGAAALSRAAAGPGEQQGGGIAAGWEPAADRLNHLGGQGDLADAGVALGAGLEAAAEVAAGLVAHVDDLQGGDGLGEVDAAAVQAGEFADVQAGAEQGGDVVPPEQRETGQQLAGFLGGEGATFAGSQNKVRVGAARGGRDLADRVGVDRALVDGELEDPQRQGAALAKGGRADLGG